MTRIIRVDVDTQHDFANADGALYVPHKPLFGTKTPLQNCIELTKDAVKNDIPIIGSVDSHAYDAWEFIENGGPFPAHCIKGTAGWLKVPGTLPAKHRFIPMSNANQMVVGEAVQGAGNRSYNTPMFAEEALAGVGLYFEKEVYSAFSNPSADVYIAYLVSEMGGKDNVTFQVFGFATGGFCVDAFAQELNKRGYRVQVVLDATAAIDGVNGPDGLEYSRKTLTEAGIECITTEQALAASVAA